MTDPFHPLSVRDIPMLTRYFARQDTRLCNASAGAAVLWQPYFQDAALELDGTLLLREQFPVSARCFPHRSVSVWETHTIFS